MLSGRHALVTDFGVAKAVSEATGDNQLTTAGVALGTPTYMAPEQAMAEPQLDHRVDIYAVGRPGLRDADRAAAVHRAETAGDSRRPGHPVPRADHDPRAAVPPALAGVVMKCLEKRRRPVADRRELLEQLEGTRVSEDATAPVTTPVRTGR